MKKLLIINLPHHSQVEFGLIFNSLYIISFHVSKKPIILATVCCLAMLIPLLLVLMAFQTLIYLTASSHQ